MNGWFLTLLIWLAIEAGAVFAKHGEPKKDNYNFGYTLISYLLIIFLAYKAIKMGF